MRWNGSGLTPDWFYLLCVALLFLVLGLFLLLVLRCTVQGLVG